jgi:cytochrome c biogenesis protein CcmG/thiol:disulfide interchange protein DsbE
MKRWIALLPLGVLGALGAVFATFGLHHDPHFIPDAMVGHPAPAEVLPRLDTGAPTELKGEFAGPTLVTFFASWCVPCVEEAPALMALKAEGVRIIGVAYKDDPGASRNFLARTGNPFSTVLVDRSGRVGIDFGVDGVPDTFLVGANGMILAKHSGPIAPADATALLDHIPQGTRTAL